MTEKQLPGNFDPFTGEPRKCCGGVISLIPTGITIACGNVKPHLPHRILPSWRRQHD